MPVIAAAAGTREQARTVLAAGKGSLTLPGCGPVVVNAGQSGYYRTLYAPAAFAPLAGRFATLAPIDQIGLLADTGRSVSPACSPRRTSSTWPRPRRRAPHPQWARVAIGYDDLLAMYGGDKAGSARLASHAIARLAPVMAQVGWTASPGEATSTATLRERLIATLSHLGDPATIAEARRRYRAMDSDPQAVPGALRKTILAVVAEHADGATWNDLHAAARAEKSPMVKDAMYILLASPRDPALAARALALALTEEPGATNGAAMIDAVSRLHPDLAVDFTLANLEAVNARVDASSRSRYVPTLADGSVLPATADKLRAYAEAHIAPQARRDAETAIAAIGDRIKVRRERLPEIDAWLARHAQ
ncbi:ERAP1-like C-terminal domain-containing protein [Massilia sp. Dwa41.01b]|uniref:ERAP1-like C-terminal domain-containing protein n=1 Tax=Massilia sp. Dwa41.01b TaxID=2709302 RepID=UPI001E45D47E|nr:ERAP1-like C-terminal domain-containing protein [Massilia sp. Dwa41.01b]